MPFTPKNWQDAPSTATPLTAASMEDLETRLAAYTDESGSAGGGVHSVLSYGGVGDGVTDDTAAINAAADAAEVDGGTVWFAPCEGGYGVTCDASPILLRDNVTFLGSGYAGRIVRIGTYEKSVGRRIFAALDTTNGIVNSTLRDLYVDGQEGLVTLASTLLNQGTTTADEAELTFDDASAFPTAGEFMIGATACSHAGKTATTLTGCVGVPAGVTDNSPVYESVGNLTSQLIRYYPLDEGEHHQRIRIQDCDFVDWPGAVLHLDDAERFVVSNNTVWNARRGGLILFHDCRNGVIEGNMVHSADDCIAIQANSNVATAAKGVGPEFISINGNTCESFAITNQFTNNGLNIQGLAHSAISGNTVIGAGESGGANKAGIRLSLSDGTNAAARYEINDVTVSGNQIYSPHGHGIYVPPDSVSGEPAKDLHVVGNQICDAYERAIFFDGYVDRVSVVANKIYNSNAGAAAAMDAMRLDDMHNYLVADNHIVGPAAQCRYGINIASACTNGSTHSNFAPDAGFSSRAFENAGDGTNHMSGNVTLALGSLGSATTITLRDGYDVTTITGTTTIDTIAAESVPRRVTLMFAASCSVRHVGGGTGNVRLNAAADQAFTANDTLTLVYNGTYWIETGRALT